MADRDSMSSRYTLPRSYTPQENKKAIQAKTALSSRPLFLAGEREIPNKGTGIRRNKRNISRNLCGELVRRGSRGGSRSDLES